MGPLSTLVKDSLFLLTVALHHATFYHSSIHNQQKLILFIHLLVPYLALLLEYKVYKGE